MKLNHLSLLALLFLFFFITSCEDEPLEGEFETVNQTPPTDDSEGSDNQNDEDNDDENNNEGNDDENGGNDDNEGNNDNQNNSGFTVNGTEYETPNGFIISDFDGTNNSVHAIYLLNGTFINNEFHGDACDYSGELTQGAIFNIRSTSVNELAAGTYEYELNSTEPALMETNISTSLTVVDNCVTDSESISEEQIISGSVTIEVVDGIYEISFTIETNDFGTINGTYTGSLETVEDLS